MVNNLKCDFCTFKSKCLAKVKLKPFIGEELRVNLTFDKCLDFKKEETTETETTVETESKTEE